MMRYGKALMQFVSASEGGRTQPLFFDEDDGHPYRPHVRVEGHEEYLGISIVSADPDCISPGEEAIATFQMIYEEQGVDYSDLVRGTRFEVLEGARIVATGEMLDVWTTDDEGSHTFTIPTDQATSDQLQALQDWFARSCDGDWEHNQGITLSTIDNPGWSVRIGLEDTGLEDRLLAIYEENFDHETDWVRCWVANGEFHGVCGPNKLNRVIQLFFAWAA